MPINVKFVIHLEATHHQPIVEWLRLQKFDVESFTPWGGDIQIESQLQCSKQFFDWKDVLTEQMSMYNVRGVKKVIPLNPEIIKDKQKWYKHWIFPMVIATAVNIGTLLGLVYTLKPDTTLVEYAVISIVPPILSFASAVGIKVS